MKALAESLCSGTYMKGPEYKWCNKERESQRYRLEHVCCYLQLIAIKVDAWPSKTWPEGVCLYAITLLNKWIFILLFREVNEEQFFLFDFVMTIVCPLEGQQFTFLPILEKNFVILKRIVLFHAFAFRHLNSGN